MRFARGWVSFAFLGALIAVSPAPAPETAVPVLTLSDSINPGTGDYLMQAIDAAERAEAPYLVLVLDTPGGLLSTTREIVKKMLGAKIPIVVFVGPKGARAGSAGALITLAADVAAMAPGTNIGAAHPVSVGGDKPDDALREKLVSDTAAFAESLARAKGRNTHWAIQAVKNSDSLPAETALKRGVVDLMAEDLSDLMTKLPGTRLRAAKGTISALPSEPATTRAVPLTLNQRLVSFIADPNLAYLILSLGGLCLWVELTHPGLIYPGVIGVVSIILSLVAFQMLPISYGALALMVVGMGMLIAEVFLPTYGLLGLGGLAAFIFGSLFLMDTAVPEFQVSLGLILPTAAVLAGSGFLLAYLVVKSRGTRNRSGLEALVGEFGEAREPVTPKSGKVFVQGELWNAISASAEATIAAGQVVVVKGVRGMSLLVEPK